MKNKCHKTLIIVAVPTGVTGPRLKFGYKLKGFPVKDQRWHAECRNCNKRIQDIVNVTSYKCH